MGTSKFVARLPDGATFAAAGPRLDPAGGLHLSLSDRLTRLLTLSDRLPANASGDRVRRAVCTLVEAAPLDQRNKVVELLTSITAAQQHPRLAPGPLASDTELVLSSLQADLVPLLRPGAFHLAGASSDGETPSDAGAEARDIRWTEWQQRGRAMDMVGRQRLRVLGLLTALAAAGVALWIWR